jgi:membrane-associated phospholipid phosphatase
VRLKVLRRAAVTGGVCAALLVSVYLLAVWTVPGQAFEDAVLRGAQLAAGGEQQATATAALDKITEYSLAVAIVLVFGIGLVRRQILLATSGAGMIIVSVMTTEILQRLVLLRPILLPSGERRADQSFPSGHTTIAMSVMCGLVMVVPYRFRGIAVFLTSLWATTVGALTVTASWHRPSDTIGSDLIVLIYACAAIALLAGKGSVREAEPRSRAARAARGSLVGLHAVEAVVAVCVGVVFGASALGDLARSLEPGDPTNQAAYMSGRAFALAGGALVALTILGLLRRIDLTAPGRGTGATGDHGPAAAGFPRRPSERSGDGQRCAETPGAEAGLRKTGQLVVPPRPIRHDHR